MSQPHPYGTTSQPHPYGTTSKPILSSERQATFNKSKKDRQSPLHTHGLSSCSQNSFAA